MNEGVTQNEVYYRKVDELQHVGTKEDLLSDDQLLLVKNDSAKRTSLGTIMDKMLEQITVPQYTINATPTNTTNTSSGVLTASSDIIGRLTPGLFISVSLTGVLDKVTNDPWTLTLNLSQNNQVLTYPIYTPDGVQVTNHYPLKNEVFNLVFLSNIQIDDDTTLTGWFIPDKIHNHDDRYYLISEIDEKVNKINTTVIPTTRGGTGAKNIVSARKNLGINPWVVVGKNDTSTITNSGYYKVLGIACDTLKSCCVKMRISSPDNVNFSFVPVEISIIIKRSDTSKSTPIVYCNTGADYYGILSKMYLAYNASTATGNVELWYKNNSTHNMLKVSVFECSTETATGDSDGLEYIQFNTSNTPLDAIDSSLTTVKLISDIVTERVVTETSSGLLTAEGYTKLLNTASQASLDAHMNDTANPHKVTKAQVGLGKVDNTADVNKSVKYAVGATNDSAGQNINTTYIKGLSVSGQTVTATRGDNTTFTITTQDKNVTNTLDTTSKAYLTGTTSATSNTGTQVFDTGVYLDTTAGSLVADTVRATTFTGALSGNASSASKLQTARTIALTGSVTGSGTFDGSGNLSIATTTNHTHSYAGSASVGGPATKAISDNAGQQIDTTYIKSLSASGKTITITKGDGSTSTITTQDTNTDTKVTNTLATTTKAYVTGTTSATTNTGTQVFDTGVYLDTTAGMLTATTFKGALSGNASTASKLATARTIALTGSVTGSGTFDGSGNLSIATTLAGDLPGNASTATKATQDSAGQQITTTYIKGLSASGTTLTITKGDGSTSTITTQDTNTDTKVTQLATTTTNYRPLMMGYTNSTDVSTLAASVTNITHVSTNIYAQPSTGTIFATTFKGALSGNASTATKATQDSAGQQINTTYIKGISVSGTKLTITKGDGSTSTITTQDTNTDTKVTNTLATTTKAYVTGTTSATTNTGTQVFDTGVYLDTTAGMLTATTFKGALSGNASTATKLATARTIALTGSVTGSGTFDGSGNLSISTTTNHTHSYLPLAGGTMTGTINSSKTASTILAGNQGAAIINSTASPESYTMLAKMNSTHGYFTMGMHQANYLLLYTEKSTVDAETNSVTKSATLLDESGDTSFPGTVSAGVLNGVLYTTGNRTSFVNNQFTAGEALEVNDLIILDASTGKWFKSTTARTYVGVAMVATARATRASGAAVYANVGMQRPVTAATVGSLAAHNLVLIQGTLGDDGVSFTTDGTITNTRTEGKEYIRAGYLQTATSIILSGTNPQILGGGSGSGCTRTPATTDTGYMHRNIAYGTSSTPTVDATYGGSGAIYIYYT